MFQFSKKIN